MSSCEPLILVAGLAVLPDDQCMTVAATTSAGDAPGADDVWPNTNISADPAVAVWLAGPRRLVPFIGQITGKKPCGQEGTQGAMKQWLCATISRAQLII